MKVGIAVLVSPDDPGLHLGGHFYARGASRIVQLIQRIGEFIKLLAGLLATQVAA